MRLISLTLLLLQTASLTVFAQAPVGYTKNDVSPGLEWHLEKPESVGYPVKGWLRFVLGSRRMTPRP